jgi:hypothetical protein
MTGPSMVTLLAGAAAASMLMAAAPASVLGDAECDDTVAHLVHDIEEETGVEELHDLEHVYCDHVAPLLP